MASSSSSAALRSIVSCKLYDAFISHRGPDVKDTLGIQLYDLLKASGCKPFLDREEIKAGDSITAAIHNAICSSRVQIAIFSTGFADSSWCLDEVVLMLQQTDALFIPLFYGVKPCELSRIDNGKSQYAKAFADYKSKGRYLNKLDGWKSALASAADKCGYVFGQHREVFYLKEVVSDVVQRVQEKEKRVPLPVAKYPVGLPGLVEDFERCCSKTKLQTEVKTVGIFGLGGCGKTTLATELFNRKSSGYDSSSFLSDVRESHARGELHRLLSQLLKDLVSINEDITSVLHGMGKVKDHLRRARHLRFLIVVDDIDHQNQLDALLPEGMLGCGSLVIITTRDQSVLRGVDARYEMREMDRNHAKDLFCSHAFRGRDPPTSYQQLVGSFADFCVGLPLSLVVLGAHVYERNEHYWNLELEKVKKIQPEDIMKRLKISFDGLDREEKHIFIDIACLFNKKIDLYYNTKNKAITIWKACGWNAEHALQTLQDRCLIKASPHFFEMHDHLRDLGRVMADESESPRLWQPELLRSMEAKGFKQTLAELPRCRCFHSFWDSSLGRKITYFIADTDLLFLEIEDGDKLLYNIPSGIPLRKLQYLSINRVEYLWSSFEEQLESHGQADFQMRKLRIADSPSLPSLPYLPWFPNKMENMLIKLMRTLPMPILTSPSLQRLPNMIEMLSHLEELYISGSLEKTDTTSFVQSIKQLSNLRLLQLVGTKNGLFRGTLDLSTGRDSGTSSRMNCLETIKLLFRGVLDPITGRDSWLFGGNLDLSEGIGNMYRLETIQIHNLQNIFKLVISAEMCPNLQTLQIESMDRLEEIELKQPGLNTLSRLEEITIRGCPELKSVEGIEELPGLISLLIEVPDNRNAWARKYIGGLTRLSLGKTILLQKGMEAKASKAKLSLLFSDVIEANPFPGLLMTKDKVKSGEYSLEMMSGSVTIYALLVTSYPFLKIDNYLIPGCDDLLIIVVLSKHMSTKENKASLGLNTQINKGFKVIFREEGEALNLLGRIVSEF